MKANRGLGVMQLAAGIGVLPDNLEYSACSACICIMFVHSVLIQSLEGCPYINRLRSCQVCMCMSMVCASRGTRGNKQRQGFYKVYSINRAVITWEFRSRCGSGRLVSLVSPAP